METSQIAIFKDKKIRRTIHENEWWFSVVDVVEALTGSERPRKYWGDLKNKLKDEDFEVSEKIGRLTGVSTNCTYPYLIEKVKRSEN